MSFFGKGDQVNVEDAEKAMNAAREAASAATAARLKIDFQVDGLSSSTPDHPLRAELRRALDAERTATTEYEKAVNKWRAARVEASIDARKQARKDREKARAEGRTPDVEGARAQLAERTATVAAERDRLAAAKAAAGAALSRAAVAEPESGEAKKSAAAHTEAQTQLAIAAARLAAAQSAESQANAALVEAEHSDDLSNFEQAYDVVEDAGDAFTAKALEAKKMLGDELAAFNEALSNAHQAYYKLPVELRESRSAHTAHRLGELFGSGGTQDVFHAAAHATKAG